MLINEQFRFIYIAVPRTASTATLKSLEKAFPASKVLGQHRTNIPKAYQDAGYTIVAGVRNPYERMASHYFHRQRYSMRSVSLWSFVQYIENLTRNRLSWWGLAADPPAVEWLEGVESPYWLRYEQLESDWRSLPVWQDSGFVPELLRGNARPITGRSWQSVYTREVAEMVYHHQRADFEHFGYHEASWRRDFAAA